MEKVTIAIVAVEDGRFISVDTKLIELKEAVKILNEYDIELKENEYGSYYCECTNGYDYADVLSDFGFEV